MERITINSARQSLTESGFRFSAPPIVPEMSSFCAECRWSSRAWENHRQWAPQQEMTEQLHWHQQERAQSLAREQGLRQLIANREARIQQLERRARRHNRIQNFLVTLSQRMERIERFLGVLQVPLRTRTPLVIDVDLDSPISTADQAN